MQFTEKKFPNLPMRESQNKEPPYPKSKIIEKKPDDNFTNIEDKDPIWLKDKADHFYKRNDYTAAISAYSKSIKADPELLMVKLNRASTFIRMRCFQQCIEDCTDIECAILNMKEEEKNADIDYYDKMMGRALVKRGAAKAWISDYDSAIKDLTAAQGYVKTFSQKEIEVL